MTPDFSQPGVLAAPPPTGLLARVHLRLPSLFAVFLLATCLAGVAAGTARATGLIVFTEAEGGLYLMRDDGTGLTSLAPTCNGIACGNRFPVFSPDGAQVAFETALSIEGEGRNVIGLVDTNGTDERFIDLGAHGFANELGFTSSDTLIFDGLHGIETIATTGGASTRLFQGYGDGEFTYECEGPLGEPLGSRCEEAFTVARSPSASSGGEIAFAAESSTRQGYALNIFIANEGGADVREITNDNASASGQGKPNFTRAPIGRASFAPKGTNFLYTRGPTLGGPGNDGSQLWEVGIDGSNDHELFQVEGSVQFLEPEFSPYETRVAYLDDQRIVESDPDGQNPVQLSPPGVRVTGFDWYKKQPADSDGDGVADVADQCPTEPGPAPTGCPDGDGDGVPNLRDLCPTVYGTASDGCPDSDSDGIDDGHDACPTVYGTLSDGCPAPASGPGSSPPTLATSPGGGGSAGGSNGGAGSGPGSTLLREAVTQVCEGLGVAGVASGGYSTLFDSASFGYGSVVLASASLGCSLALTKLDSNVFAEAACGALTGASMSSGMFALLSAPSVFGGLLLGGISYLTGDLSTLACSADPPSASYREIAKAHVQPLHVRFPRGLSRAEKDPLLALLADAARGRAYGLAMVACIDRASGAAAAHDSAWAARQHKCAALNARILASVYRTAAPLLERAQGTLKAPGGSSSKLSRSTVIATLEHPSAAARKLLAKEGVSKDALLLAQFAAPHLPLPSTTALGDVIGTQTIAAMRSAAKAFQQIATENQVR